MAAATLRVLSGAAALVGAGVLLALTGGLGLGGAIGALFGAPAERAGEGRNAPAHVPPAAGGGGASARRVARVAAAERGRGRAPGSRHGRRAPASQRQPHASPNAGAAPPPAGPAQGPAPPLPDAVPPEVVATATRQAAETVAQLVPSAAPLVRDAGAVVEAACDRLLGQCP